MSSAPRSSLGRRIYKGLFTHEDKYNIHKLFGLSCLLHFLYSARLPRGLGTEAGPARQVQLTRARAAAVAQDLAMWASRTCASTRHGRQLPAWSRTLA